MTFAGEVSLHRLTWTRAWNLIPPKDGVLVNAISWRPDGKILAIGYNSGEKYDLFCLHNINIIHFHF